MTKLLPAIQTSHHSFTHANARGKIKRIIIDQMAFSRVFVVNGGEEMQEGAVEAMDDIDRIVLHYGTMLYRICLVMLGNHSDAEDAVQNTFLAYLQKAPPFAGAEHEKAWLIKVATNQCRNMRRFWRAHPQVEFADIQCHLPDAQSSGILEALMQLPERFRIVMILYYVEEYSMEAIAGIIGRTTSAVKMRLQKGRRLLEETYRREYL